MLKKSGSRRGASGLSVYSNLSAQRRNSRDARSRRRAEYLATLPKHPVKRVMYRLDPRRLAAFWFSREGGIMALKIAGVGALVMIVFTGALFAYYRRELDAIRPGEISKRVQTTVTKYYDRNGTLLWEDRGDGDYKLVVDSDDISQHMKEATVAIEDKDFYRHRGISPTGIIRAAFNNFSGGSTQGGSTLTQQLIKNVFLEDEAQNRGFDGVSRKIKEVILAVEVERMYNKDQILSMYLNEVPYGGRRNGVESAAQTYFGKTAKELTLAESALLAGIPQQPGLYDPYNPEGHESLLARQKVVLDKMVEERYVTKQEADAAKKIAVLDTIRPESEAFKDTKAPHFVRLVRSQLEKELGSATVGRGGLAVKTTLDWRLQQLAEKAVSDLFTQSGYQKSVGFDNSAMTAIDAQTGQIIAMVGSRGFSYPEYGQTNAAVSYLQPGSSIKPLVFASLFKQRAGQNYGVGTVLRDEPLPQSIYQTDGKTPLQNYDRRFRGDITIRQGLAESRNVPAVKAMYLNGRNPTIDTIREIGDKSYCTQGSERQVGLAAAIGGCTLKQVEHVNAFATLARGGEYKKESYFIEVKNAQGQTLKKWKNEGKQVLDPQIPFMLSDILSDENARAPTFGRNTRGMSVPGVKTATKTGTTNLENASKDLWMMSYSTRIVAGVWIGNHNNQPLKTSSTLAVGYVIDKFMGPAHRDVLAKDGTWKSGDWFQQPKGLQRLSVQGRTDWFPSWYSKPDSSATTTMTFDSVSKKKATDCTPARAKQEIAVSTYTDPATKKKTLIVTNGYDATKEDDVHKCDDIKPYVANISTDNNSISTTVNAGTHPLQSIEFKVDGKVVGTLPAGSDSNYKLNYDFEEGSHDITVTVIDSVLYEGSDNKSLKIGSNSQPQRTTLSDYSTRLRRFRD